MKLDKIFAALFIGLAMTACSNDDEMTTGGQDQSPVTGGTAYMSVSLNMPKSTGTRSSSTSHGTGDEQKVDEVMLALFDAGDVCLGTRVLLTSEYKLTVGGGAPTGTGAAFQVPAATKKVLAVINPSVKFKNVCVAPATWLVINSALEQTVEEVIGAAKNHFMMINDGAGGHALVDVTVSKALSSSTGDINAAKATAEASPASINVDRVVAKVTLEVNSSLGLPDGVTCAFGDWALNVTNKDMFPCSDIVAPAGSMSANYRIDNNYSHGSFNVSNFNYLALNAHGVLPSDFSPMADSKYCLENTMEAIEQKQAQTTSAVVSATYIPKGFNTGKSWFRLLGVSYKTFDDLKAVYNAANVVGASPLQVQQKDLCDEFYARIADMATAQSVSWTATGFSSLDIDEMDGVLNGGEASKPGNAQTLGVEYFQKGTCYYSILIRHDDAVTGAMELGKYGVVRNNWYTLTINSVSKPGTPWIPDPTNPVDSTDPGKDNDEAEAFIAVGITVNAWTTWSQGVDL